MGGWDGGRVEEREGGCVSGREGVCGREGGGCVCEWEGGREEGRR